jgi:negative regulator of sigma E activity
MANFDETALRSPREAVPSIRTDTLEPWMVQVAAGAIAAMALLGVAFGIKGAHPASGVGLSLNSGVAVSPTAASPAVGLPKDSQWSTLSGPAVLAPSAAPAKVASAAEQDADSDEDASDQPAAATAAATDQDVTAPPKPVQISPPPPAPTGAAGSGQSDSSGLW